MDIVWAQKIEIRVLAKAMNLNATSIQRRETKKMTTLEMMNLAKETGKTYKIQDMLYNVSRGFHDKNGKSLDGYAFDKLNDLFNIKTWQEDPTIYMTKAEAEEKYGIKIIE